jgi:hypothetical protein
LGVPQLARPGALFEVEAIRIIAAEVASGFAVAGVGSRKATRSAGKWAGFRAAAAIRNLLPKTAAGALFKAADLIGNGWASVYISDSKEQNLFA